MQRHCLISAAAAIVLAQSIGPASATPSTKQIALVQQSGLNPLLVVGVYGLADPSVLCAASASVGVAQVENGNQEPAPEESTVEAPPTTEAVAQDGCVLPVMDQAGTIATPPATSEIAPLFALGPLLAAAGITATAAAIAASNEDAASPNIPVSPS